MLAACAALLAPAAAHASDSAQPVAYAGRPLTLPSLTLAPEVSVLVDELSTDTLKTLNLKNAKNLHLTGNVGVHFGIIDVIEVGGVVAPLNLLPEFAYGNPSVYGTFRLFKGSFEMAAHVNTTFITHMADNPQLLLPVLNSKAGVLLEPGLQMRVHAGEKVKVDLAGYVPIQLGDKANDLGLKVPVEVAFSLSESFFFGLQTGFGVVNFRTPKLEDSYVPLGVLGGYTVSGQSGPMVDIGLHFIWPKFINPGQERKIDYADFQIGVSGIAYIYFI
jgi:hypothetical protein